MSFFTKRKRKNDEPPRFPLWIIVVFVIGLAIAAVLISQSQPVGSVTNSETHSFSSTNIDLTATYIIQQATAAAQGTPPPVSSELDPFQLTATYIVDQATASAQELSQPAQISTLDPLELTATYLITVATESAGQSGSSGS